MPEGTLRHGLRWLVIGALLVLATASIAGPGGVIDLWRLHEERRNLASEVFELARTNDRLRQRILEIRRSDRALERLARSKLGFVGEGELVYRFAPDPSGSP